MSGYAVDPGALQHCDDLLVDAVVRSRSGLTQLRTAAGELLDARWEGAAASAFRLGWEQWLDGVMTMLAALDDMAGALGSSGAGYATTEATVRTSLAAAT